jgi:hypothetical protein
MKPSFLPSIYILYLFPFTLTLTETARIKQRSEENAMKKVTRRFEEAKISVLNARGVTESLRFDPKLKGKGLLDLYLEKQPDSAVPDSKPSSKKTS